MEEWLPYNIRCIVNALFLGFGEPTDAGKTEFVSFVLSVSIFVFFLSVKKAKP